jgi:DNA-binding protein H-NS
MPTLAEIRAQIEALQQQEEEILAQERDAVIAQIKQQIVDYRLSATDLGLTIGSPSPAQRAVWSAASVAPVEKTIKYRRGDDTWSGGRGPKPKWVRELIEHGEDIEQYRVA